MKRSEAISIIANLVYRLNPECNGEAESDAILKALEKAGMKPPEQVGFLVRDHVYEWEKE